MVSLVEKQKVTRSLGSLKAWAVLLGVVCSLSACMGEKVRNQINENAEITRQTLDNVIKQGVAEQYNPLMVTNKVWAGDSALRIHRGIPLPPRYETPKGVTIVSAEPVTLADLTEMITEQTGIAIHVTDMSSSRTSGLGGGQLGGGAGGSGVGNFSSPVGGTSSSGARSINMNEDMSVAYEGPLSGLLEKMAGNFGVAWRYDGSSIQVSRFETRVFSIEALPGSQTVSIDMQGSANSGGGGAGGGGSGASAGGSSSSSATFGSTTSIDLKYWDELKEIITSMLAGTGSIVMSPSLGTVTVRTTPELLQAVASYISQENERLSHQIAINISVYNVSIQANEDFNVTFSAFIRQLGQAGISGASAPTSVGALTGLLSANVAIINQEPGHDSATGIFKALSAVGNTTRAAQFPMITLNNRPVSVRIGKDISYVSSVSSDASTSSGSTTNTVTIETSQIHQGFNVQVAPRILEDGRVLMQYSMTSVDLDKIESFNSKCGLDPACTAGDSSATLQLPTTTNRVFNQQTVLRSGSTLVIGGVTEKTAGQNAQGVGDPFNFLTGGGTSSQQTQTMMLISITPQVIDVVRSERG